VVTPSTAPGILEAMIYTTTIMMKKLLSADSARPEASPFLQSSSRKFTFRQRTGSQTTSVRRLATPHHCRIFNSLTERQTLTKSSALIGFLLSLTPLSNVLLGWRGSGGLGAAEVYVTLQLFHCMISSRFSRLATYRLTYLPAFTQRFLHAASRASTDIDLVAPTTSSVVF
jgi:hypothetical protein